MSRVFVRLLAICLAAAPLSVASAQTPLTTELVLNGPSDTVLLLSPPDDDRLFLVVQSGEIRIIENGSLLPTPFLDISTKVNFFGFGDERGLLSMAFDPNYADNGQFYVYYTGTSGPNGNAVLERYTVSGSDRNVADPLSVCTIFGGIFQPFANHNGGHLAFGPDGMLYLSTGDGGSGNDPGCRSQDVTDQLGKMLRIEVDPQTCGFTIPTDNPFQGMGGQSNRVWHVGLRNTWRWSFDRLTGEMYLGDVGQNAREEVSYAPAGVGGLNYGWRVEEGDLCNGLGNCPVMTTPGCGDPVFTDPIQTYNHLGGRCSITGGYVYRGCAIPDLQGTYFYADVCSNQIWSLRYDGSTVTEFQQRTSELDPPTGGNINTIVSFGEDRYGELYIVELGGQIWKIVPDATVAGADCDANEQIDACEISSGYVTDFNGDTLPDPCNSLQESSNLVAEGTSVEFTLDVGPAADGDFYWVQGSATGTSPGIVVGPGIVQPLVFDGYTDLTLTDPLNPIFTDLFGFLDQDGRATAALNIPGNLSVLDPGLIGITLYHAFVTSADLSTVNFASNFMPVTTTL